MNEPYSSLLLFIHNYCPYVVVNSQKFAGTLRFAFCKFFSLAKIPQGDLDDEMAVLLWFPVSCQT